MSETPDTPTNDPQPPDEAQSSRIGIDSWVAEAEGRRSRSPAALLGRGWETIPDSAKLIGFLLIGASAPFWLLTSGGDLFNFGLFTLIYVALGLGLNVPVGLAGLLDLGYVAFFGIGAYAYALLSSPYYGIHWPAEATLPIAMLAAGLAGSVLGFSSRRLLGDYLAIVTLFFAQAFLAFTNTANPTVAGKGLTGGANGIPLVDPLTFFGYSLRSTRQLYFFMLIVVGLIAAGIYLANQSRTGRAWRASREDPLAAEVMSIPVNRLKILAFVFGAAIAGLVGAIYAAVITAAVSTNFGIGVLIILYAIVILGGFGSIAGVFVGAIVINVSFEFLEPQTDHPAFKRWLFYGLIIILVALLKPWYRAALVLLGTLACGFAVHAIVNATAGAQWTSGVPVAGASWLRHWVVIPGTPRGNFDNLLYIGLVLAILVVASLKGWWRAVALAPTLYLTAMVWENVLTQNPAVTAFILFGVMLIGLMAVRPQGLLGTARVEIV